MTAKQYFKALIHRVEFVLPSPKGTEAESDFVNRCMSNETMKSEYPDQKQRVAVCYSQYRRSKKS